jgi:2-polyprenyl-3-methyl-5-hydroxy-6-metoxy-1,4-benzoquinol methylase
MIKKLLSYYSNIDVNALNLKPGIKKQFEHKLQYLSDEKSLNDLWKYTKTYFDKYSVAIDGKIILDVGCGTGWLSIIFLMLGAKKIVAVDLNHERLEAFKVFLSFLPSNLRSRIEILEERIENLSFDNQFDIIACNESISHIVDDKLFLRLFNFLKKGGALFVSDGNNVLYRKYRRQLIEFWYRVENGPPGMVGDRKIEKTYKEHRREMISEWYSEKLKETEITMLSENTVYLHGDFLKTACERYVRTGEKPNSTYQHGKPPIHPEIGAYWEKLFNPYQLQKEMLSLGFVKCHVDSIMGINRSWPVRVAIQLTPLRLKFLFFNIIKLMAIK